MWPKIKATIIESFILTEYVSRSSSLDKPFNFPVIPINSNNAVVRLFSNTTDETPKPRKANAESSFK